MSSRSADFLWDVGYFTALSGGFTDNAGLTVGDYRSHSGDIGARVQLDWVIVNAGMLWMPYVGATIDQAIGFHDALTIPDQAAFAADTVHFNEAKTFGGARLGLQAMTRAGWEFGAEAFYEASSDLSFVGGQGYMKVHF